MLKIILSLFLSGLFFGSGPCLASCGPILISYIAGSRKDVPRAIISYILFSAGRIFVYIVLGVLFFFLGSLALERSFERYSKYILFAGGIFIIIMGLLMALGKSLELKFCKFLEHKILEKDKKSIFMLGLFIGLLPCGPLLAILSYVGLISKHWLQSSFYSLAFGVGTFVSPLALLAVFAGLLPRFFVDKRAVFGRIFSFICGLIIVFLGVELIRRAY